MGRLLGVDAIAKTNGMEHYDVERVRHVAAIPLPVKPEVASDVNQHDHVAPVGVPPLQKPDWEDMVAVGRLAWPDPLSAEPAKGLHGVLHIEGRTVGR